MAPSLPLPAWATRTQNSPAAVRRAQHAFRLLVNNRGFIPGGKRGFTLVAGLACTLLLFSYFSTPSTLHSYYSYYSSSSSPSTSDARSDLLSGWKNLPPKVIYPETPDHAYPLPLSATLEERLHAFRNAPGVGWEPPDFVAWNLQTCGEATPNHNKDLIAKASLTWSVLNSSSILEHRERMARFLEHHQSIGSFDDPDLNPYTLDANGLGQGSLVGKGRGIVFTAGNADTLGRVVTTLKLLRQRYRCKLPAAIYHFPSENPGEDDNIRIELASLNAKLVSVTGEEKDETREKNWHLKAISIVQSEWAEVIYLDSDNFPAADPSLLFNAPAYVKLGAYFAPDYWKTSASNPIWHILGVQCRDEWEQEAGQIVVDKRRNLDAMLLSLYMLKDWRYWFMFSDGDKDVFRFSMLALRKRWALPGRYVGVGGLPNGVPTGDFCGHTMQQYDHEGKPLFVHYNLMKQMPSGLGRGRSWGRTKQVRAYPSVPAESTTVKLSELPSPSDHTNDDPSANSPSSPSTQHDTRQWVPLTYFQHPYPQSLSRDHEKLHLFNSTEVEADMLANADPLTGWAIQPATEEVRKRAVLERGLRPYFHGGGNSAFCIDVKWVDPRKEALVVKTGKEEERLYEKNGKPLEVEWTQDGTIELVQWSSDKRLRIFEDNVYDMGFQPHGYAAAVASKDKGHH
ncbi:uncharacterized protein STEHIDRAFT_171646 [Stereum hirsutum FP-91666 SS1]|uniref:uncharacterized protein n=1 Tax=Stereum hirsutum (strain FP-91666) TaxID=721885 RepID=UPI000444A78C|nr:uncharacterized protein STEHIDRAFT_171646 [Stereum hirsutum FP-91666 SS1]EIM82059.1 hypothetical protein STEHIDRAFT_171646 [Stereum hirsutum FP-91666 SS1]